MSDQKNESTQPRTLEETLNDFGLEPHRDPSTVRFVAYGPNRGKTTVLAGFQFTDGVLVADRNHEIAVTNILTRFYDVAVDHQLAEAVVAFEAARAQSERDKAAAQRQLAKR